MFSLAGKTCVVTGASRGLGRGIALAFAEQGADVVLAARTRADLEKVGSEVEAKGRRAHLLTADITDLAQLQKIADAGVKAFGRIDVWVNNAGADVLTGEAAGWDWDAKLDLLLAVDLRGTIACSYAVAEVMAARPEGGLIVNMSWDHVTAGMPGRNPELFSAVKGGVLAFSKSLARSVAPGVRVNVLCPGWIETKFGAGAPPDLRRRVVETTPLGRWGRPDDVAEAAVFLASPAAAFWTGQALNVNGGAIM